MYSYIFNIKKEEDTSSRKVDTLYDQIMKDIFLERTTTASAISGLYKAMEAMNNYMESSTEKPKEESTEEAVSSDPQSNEDVTPVEEKPVDSDIQPPAEEEKEEPTESVEAESDEPSEDETSKDEEVDEEALIEDKNIEDSYIISLMKILTLSKTSSLSKKTFAVLPSIKLSYLDCKLEIKDLAESESFSVLFISFWQIQYP